MTRTPRTTKKATQSQTEKESEGPRWEERFLTALRNAGTVTGAAKIANIGRTTVYDAMRTNPTLAQKVRAIQDECVELVETTLYQQALQPGSTTDRIFYLKTNRPEKYADKLNPQQVNQIREEARREARDELRQAIASLTPQARDVVLEAISRAALKELAAP